jgi:Protein of unknown function (DUF3363)
LSVPPLDRQVGADGATWLDHRLVADAPVTTREAGLGRDVRDALARRRYTEAVPDQSIEGIYRRRVDLASGRFALIEKSRELTLVP